MEDRSESSEPTIRLRPVQPEDEPFLLAVYASTREEEMAQTGWSHADIAAFLRMQFLAQQTYYLEQYDNATYSVIEADGQLAGRLYVARWPDDIRVMDIALLPAWRGRGIGTRLLQSIIAEGRETGRKVSIHVEIFNPARHLYARLGFRDAGESGVYQLMEWTPDS
jgi:ribosomal protein S18 acetylase RimI-like enzyme